MNRNEPAGSGPPSPEAPLRFGASPVAEVSTGEARQQAEEAGKLAGEYGLPFMDSIEPGSLDPVLVANIPVEWARANCMLPVRIGGRPSVLLADPRQTRQQEYVSLLVGEDLAPVLAPRGVILQCIESCYYSKEDSPREFLKDLARTDRGAGPAQARTDDLLQVAEKAPVTQLVNLILLDAVKHRASDIHFEPFEAKLRVRYRIDGILFEQASPPKHLEESLVSRLKIMARLDIAEKRLPQDGMARVRVGEREIDIRMSTVPVAEGERIVLRLLDRDSALLPLEILGMPPDLLDAFHTLLKQPNGIIVVSGPTGSGKTTTLYAALQQLNAARRNIMTIEEPIEYQLPDIGQIQVKPKIGLTFANGLRHILRQDPDIILVGETRDLETAEIAVRASLTGHLVFTTLHTNDAAGSVLRLVDMGVEPYLLAACLKGVLAQRLVRRLCTHCRRETVVSAQEAAACGRLGRSLAGTRAWVPVGCPACLEGYAGRTGLFELMKVDADMSTLLRSGSAGVDRLRALAEEHGMRSLDADGLRKVADGVTSVAELLSVVG